MPTRSCDGNSSGGEQRGGGGENMREGSCNPRRLGRLLTMLQLHLRGSVGTREEEEEPISWRGLGGHRCLFGGLWLDHDGRAMCRGERRRQRGGAKGQRRHGWMLELLWRWLLLWLQLLWLPRQRPLQLLLLLLMLLLLMLQLVSCCSRHCRQRMHSRRQGGETRRRMVSGAEECLGGGEGLHVVAPHGETTPLVSGAQVRQR